MKIRCLMMFRNEDDLLSPWIDLHGALFGFDNLRLFDNGSTSPGTVAQIEAWQARGISIDRSHARGSDFAAKGDLFAAAIRAMDADDPADFYLPLDCDEFVGADLGREMAFGSDAVCAALEPYAGHGGSLSIRMAYQNIPGANGRFRPAFGALTKLFFARDACRTLDRGFHAGTGRIDAPPRETPLIHVHYHNKPLALLQEHARQKLVAGGVDLGPEGLARLRANREPGFHLLDYLDLPDETAYRARFDGGFRLDLPDFVRAFRALGRDLPFSGDA